MQVQRGSLRSQIGRTYLYMLHEWFFVSKWRHRAL